VPSSTGQQEFLELFEHHGAALMGMLRRLCGNHHQAEDVFQDTAVRIWRSFSSRPRLRNPKAWIMTIGYRAFLDARGRRRPLEALPDVVDDRSESPRQMAEQAETCDRLQSVIADLPEPLREVVVLHYVGGLTLSQTAAAMQISQGTVKSRLNAALTKLRSVLQ
jgi:RNA polymerase sigma-70 factor, ECF subfamily